MDEAALQIRISFLIEELHKSMLPESRRLSIRQELDSLLDKRRVMLETLARHNTFMPEALDIIDDSSDD
jgi:hypothetical protein